MEIDNNKLNLFLQAHQRCNGTFKISHNQAGKVTVRCAECNASENITQREEKVYVDDA